MTLKSIKTKLRLNLILIRGWWRSLWKHCPACNDDAPECDTCFVCQNWSGRKRPEWPAPENLRERWWVVFRSLIDPPYTLKQMDELSEWQKEIKLGNFVIIPEDIKPSFFLVNESYTEPTDKCGQAHDYEECKACENIQIPKCVHGIPFNKPCDECWKPAIPQNPRKG